MRIERLKRRNERRRGQGMLEFALAIPVFLLLLLGIIEFGRMFLMYTSVFAAAREGARYGAAVDNLASLDKECDIAGVIEAARRVGFFAGDMEIGIQYDDGYGNEKPCENTVLGDRINVTATIYFRSITGVIPEIPLRAIARRTIIRQVFLQWTLAPTSAISGAIPPTATFGPPPVTPGPSSTPDPNATSTRTATIALTPTTTNTPQPPECGWEWEVGNTEDKFYYLLHFDNKTPNIQPLNVVSVSWVSDNGNIKLRAIDFFYPSGDYDSIGTNLPDSDGEHTEDLSASPLAVMPGESVVRFTFSKQDTTILSVILNFSSNGSECIVQYP